jgi:hypothetical protein
MEGQERDYGHRRAPARGASAPRPCAKIRHKQVDADSSKYFIPRLTHVIDVLHAAVHTLVISSLLFPHKHVGQTGP